METVDFTYSYPYCGYGNVGRFRCQWADSRIKINGNYTYPVVFNTAVPKIMHIQIDVEVTDTGSGSVKGIGWQFQIYRKSTGWSTVKSFTMPQSGEYTVDCDIDRFSVLQFAVVPASQQPSARTWSLWCTVREMIITEQLEVNELRTGTFQHGVFPNYGGVSTSLTETYVNIDGTLKRASDILINIDGELMPLAPVYSAYLRSEEEAVYLYKFIPSETGTYRIQNKLMAGDHEIRLYDSTLTPVYNGAFYSESFPLTGGSVYYITQTHYYNEEECESYLQVYKED